MRHCYAMISVVIPLYNKELSVGRTILSVLAQTYQKFEIIVVNDGSTDKSYDEVRKIEDTRIRIISQKNSGVSKTRNTGVNEAKFDYIALLDADDLWEPTFLEEMISLIRDFPEASLFGSSWYNLQKDGSKSTFIYGYPLGYRGYIDNYFDITTYNTLFNSSSVIIEKKSFLEVGMFDETICVGEDLDLWLRFGLKKRLAYLNKPLSFYVLGAENRATNNIHNIDKCLINRLDKFKNEEISNPDFKTFLDTWRFHNISDFFEGKRHEVYEAKSILKEMELKNFASFWTILRYSPSWMHKLLYKLRKFYINARSL